MQIVTEAEARQRVGCAAAIMVVREAFEDLSRGLARTLPVVRRPLANGKGTFGVKSGELDRHGVVGLKAGGYWPGNASGTSGLTNHQSTCLVFNAETGQVIAAVEANWLTEVRTSAAGAVAIALLSREDSRSLGIVGTGLQARSQIRAALTVRPFETIRVDNRNPAQAGAICRDLAAEYPEIAFKRCSREETVRESDVLITVTPSKDALFPLDWSPEGQHINAMGADTIGKHELDRGLLVDSRLVYDDRDQSLVLGEFQQLGETLAGMALGDIATGRAPGRGSDSERTIFDSTGIALQDLAVAVIAMRTTG